MERRVRGAGAFTSITEVVAFAEKLTIVACWFEELQRKLGRAMLRFELSELGPDEQEQLAKEVFAFTSLCRAVAHTLKADHYIGREGGPPQPAVEPRGPKKGKRNADHSATDKVRRLATSVVAASATKGGSTS